MTSRLTGSKKGPLLIAAFIGFWLVVIIVSMGLIPRTSEVSWSNAGVIRVTPAPFLTSLMCETSCKIVYQPKNGQSGTIVLLEDSDSQPAMIIPAADGKTFLCLYYADVLYRLMRVDPSKRPTPFPPQNYLNYIVLSSSCHIEPGTADDWHQASEYVKAVPADVFNQQSLGFRRQVLSSGVNQTIWNMQHGFIK